jgi:hypothetical protein
MKRGQPCSEIVFGLNKGAEAKAFWRFRLAVQCSIVETMNDALGLAEIQFGIIEPRRQKNAIERLEGDAFGALIDKLLAQLTKEGLLLGRKRRAKKGGRIFHTSPSFNVARTQTGSGGQVLHPRLPGWPSTPRQTLLPPLDRAHAQTLSKFPAREELTDARFSCR